MKFYLPDPRSLVADLTPPQLEAYEAVSRAVAQANAEFRSEFTQVDSLAESEICLLCRSYNTFGPFFCDYGLEGPYKDRNFVYSVDDNDFPMLPGIFAGSPPPKYHELGWAATGQYLSGHLQEAPIDCLEESRRDILFSFIGSSATHPIREQILALKHPEAVLEESWKKGGVAWWRKDRAGIEEHQKHFRDMITRTRFALCPRGAAASSIRLFEVMEAGCVPVVISDPIVFPEGPDWDEFVLRVPEAEVARIPELIESKRGEFAARSRAARRCWEEYYAPTTRATTLLRSVQRVKTRLEGRRARVAAQVHRDSLATPEALRQRGRFLKTKLMNHLRGAK